MARGGGELDADAGSLVSPRSLHWLNIITSAKVGSCYDSGLLYRSGQQLFYATAITQIKCILNQDVAMLPRTKVQASLVV